MSFYLLLYRYPALLNTLGFQFGRHPDRHTPQQHVVLVGRLVRGLFLVRHPTDCDDVDDSLLRGERATVFVFAALLLAPLAPRDIARR